MAALPCLCCLQTSPRCMMRTGKSQIFESVALIIVRIFREHIRIWRAGRQRTPLPVLLRASAGAAESAPNKEQQSTGLSTYGRTEGGILCAAAERPHPFVLLLLAIDPAGNSRNARQHLVAAIKLELTGYKASRYIATNR